MQSKEKWGLIDASGAFVIRLRFNGVLDFSEGLAAVEFSNDKDQWGYIDHTGIVVIKQHFGDAGDFNEGLAPVAVFPREFHEQISGFSGRELPAFRTRQEALTWLVAD